MKLTMTYVPDAMWVLTIPSQKISQNQFTHRTYILEINTDPHFLRRTYAHAIVILNPIELINASLALNKHGIPIACEGIFSSIFILSPFTGCLPLNSFFWWPCMYKANIENERSICLDIFLARKELKDDMMRAKSQVRWYLMGIKGPWKILIP